MNIIIKIICYTIIFNLWCIGQEKNKPKIYIDIDGEQIDEFSFYSKALKCIYSDYKIDRDSVVINKLERRYHFGSLSEKELVSFKSILLKNYGLNNLDRNLILVYKKKPTTNIDGIQLKKIENHKNKELFIKYKKDVKAYDLQQKKCLKKMSRKNTMVLYLHLDSIIANKTYSPKNYTLSKINNFIKDTFFKFEDRGVVIIKPDGNYFFFQSLTEDLVFKMLRNDWNKYINEYNLVLKNPNKIKMSFIEDMKLNAKLNPMIVPLTKEERKSSSQKFKTIYWIDFKGCYTNVGP